jgi:hypothetical protein
VANAVETATLTTSVVAVAVILETVIATAIVTVTADAVAAEMTVKKQNQRSPQMTC